MNPGDCLLPVKPSSDRVNVYVTRYGAKYKAVYAFEAKRLTKIRTAAQLKADHDSGRYRLIGVDALEVI